MTGPTRLLTLATVAAAMGGGTATVAHAQSEYACGVPCSQFPVNTTLPAATEDDKGVCDDHGGIMYITTVVGEGLSVTHYVFCADGHVVPVEEETVPNDAWGSHDVYQPSDPLPDPYPDYYYYVYDPAVWDYPDDPC